LTALEAGGLLIVIVAGLSSWGTLRLFPTIPSGFAGVWGAAALIFFAYLGFDELGDFAEEIKAPARDLPRCSSRFRRRR